MALGMCIYTLRAAERDNLNLTEHSRSQAYRSRHNSPDRHSFHQTFPRIEKTGIQRHYLWIFGFRLLELCRMIDLVMIPAEPDSLHKDRP
jgi:hypothetical protein